MPAGSNPISFGNLLVNHGLLVGKCLSEYIHRVNESLSGRRSGNLVRVVFHQLICDQSVNDFKVTPVDSLLYKLTDYPLVAFLLCIHGNQISRKAGVYGLGSGLQPAFA
jgi:hypothetical protein